MSNRSIVFAWDTAQRRMQRILRGRGCCREDRTGRRICRDHRKKVQIHRLRKAGGNQRRGGRLYCRNQKEATVAAEELSKYIEILDSNPEQMDFGNGIMVLPVEYTKGLEFDAVLILNPTKEAYPVDDGHAKLLYVAATRALHELCVCVVNK